MALEELDHQGRHVDAGRLFESRDAWRGIDLEHGRAVSCPQHIDAADIEAERACRAYPGAPLLRGDADLLARTAAVQVRVELAQPSLPLHRRHHFVPDHESA